MVLRRNLGRAERRARAREQEKLARDRVRLAHMAPGGTPQRPLEVDTPAVVDLRAVVDPCPLCGGALRLEEHAAETIDAVRLRVAAVACTLCGTRRKIYFRLVVSELH